MKLTKTHVTIGLVAIASFVVYRLVVKGNIEGVIQTLTRFHLSHNEERTIYAADDEPYGIDVGYKYWKDFNKNNAKMYANIEKYNDNVIGRDEEAEEMEVKQDSMRHSARTMLPSVPAAYYKDPVNYCKRNPGSYPCPNFWVKSVRTKVTQDGYMGKNTDPASNLQDKLPAVIENADIYRGKTCDPVVSCATALTNRYEVDPMIGANQLTNPGTPDVLVHNFDDNLGVN